MTTIKVGNTHVKIYHWRAKSGYEQFKVDYRADGKRKRETFGSLAKAKARANEIAIQIERGERAMLKLTSAELATYLHARRLLEPLSMPLNVAVEEYVAARKHLGEGDSLLAAAKAFAKRSHNHRDKPVADVVAELLEDKKQNGASVRYFKTLRSHLKRFAAAFRTNI